MKGLSQQIGNFLGSFPIDGKQNATSKDCLQVSLHQVTNSTKEIRHDGQRTDACTTEGCRCWNIAIEHLWRWGLRGHIVDTSWTHSLKDWRNKSRNLRWTYRKGWDLSSPRVSYAWYDTNNTNNTNNETL